MRQNQVQIITDGDMSGDVTSSVINLMNNYAFSIQCIWSGGAAPIGNFKLQGSNDNADQNGINAIIVPTNWTDINSSVQPISGTPGSLLFDVTECSYRWARVVYLRTSGSGTLQANLNTKGV